jgi:hypothetical protein
MIMNVKRETVQKEEYLMGFVENYGISCFEVVFWKV